MAEGAYSGMYIQEEATINCVTAFALLIECGLFCSPQIIIYWFNHRLLDALRIRQNNALVAIAVTQALMK
jgi:hypothetical protein